MKDMIEVRAADNPAHLLGYLPRPAIDPERFRCINYAVLPPLAYFRPDQEPDEISFSRVHTIDFSVRYRRADNGWDQTAYLSAMATVTELVRGIREFMTPGEYEHRKQCEAAYEAARAQYGVANA